jgi:hypothetical protein
MKRKIALRKKMLQQGLYKTSWHILLRGRSKPNIKKLEALINELK